ncbi:hypothetical protein B5K06_33850 [Rhizobium grahamii]|uniref:Uncharacterized protein n=1 Tax=Rhizobium grahamii TaxID=1120045 RepID=A0A370KFC3_9HYPH|nr:hypothetical protein B5K06_33850 [Rhizobium grahamii]
MHRNGRNAVEDGEDVASVCGSCRPYQETGHDGRAIDFISFFLLAGVRDTKGAGPPRSGRLELMEKGGAKAPPKVVSRRRRSAFR